MNKQTFKIPFWAVNSLVMATFENLTTNEIAKIQAFVDTEAITGFLSIESEPYFSWSNDVDTLGGMVYDLLFTIETE